MWLVVTAILAAITCSQAAESVHMTVLPPPKSASNDSSIIRQSPSNDSSIIRQSASKDSSIIRQSASKDLSIIRQSASNPARIVGGNPTTIEKYPYAVQVLHKCSFRCGGTLLTNRHVASTAGCMNDDDLSAYAIRVGATRLNVGGSVHSVSKIVRHEKYHYDIEENNVAVLLLASNVLLGGGTVAVATLPEQGYTLPKSEMVRSTCECNATLFAVGWGSTNKSEQSSMAPVLMEVEMVEVSFEECVADFSDWEYEITTNLICARVPGAEGKGPCYDDWGAPLIYQGMVVGIDMLQSCDGSEPAVFTKVANYADWINATVQSLERGQVLRRGGEDAGAAAAAAAGAGLALLAPLLLLCFA